MSKCQDCGISVDSEKDGLLCEKCYEDAYNSFK